VTSSALVISLLRKPEAFVVLSDNPERKSDISPDTYYRITTLVRRNLVRRKEKSQIAIVNPKSWKQLSLLGRPIVTTPSYEYSDWFRKVRTSSYPRIRIGINKW
jgi:hypothetical protein